MVEPKIEGSLVWSMVEPRIEGSLVWSMVEPRIEGSLVWWSPGLGGSPIIGRALVRVVLYLYDTRCRGTRVPKTDTWGVGYPNLPYYSINVTIETYPLS